jgi:dTDP-4-dehydrorhamnose 3,5-epimerase
MSIALHITALPGVIEIRPERFGDARGYFCETYNEAAFAKAGLPTGWFQDNQSLSRAAGTLRGLHFQTPPCAQAKLVRAVRGRIYDVAVDIRRGSPNFGQWVGVELTAAAGNQLYIPEGFAHGLLTLEPDTEVAYKVSAPYSKAHDRTIRFDDPRIAIRWPDIGRALTLSDKDANAPFLAELKTDIGLAETSAVK